MVEINKSIEVGQPLGLYNILMSLKHASLPTEGNVYYVAKKGNNTDGSSWENAFITIAAAIAASNATVSWSGNLENNYILVVTICI